MKEATGELNMTIITVIAVAAIGLFLVVFVPKIINSIQDQWDQGAGQCVTGHTSDGDPIYGACSTD